MSEPANPYESLTDAHRDQVRRMRAALADIGQRHEALSDPLILGLRDQLAGTIAAETPGRPLAPNLAIRLGQLAGNCRCTDEHTDPAGCPRHPGFTTARAALAAINAEMYAAHQAAVQDNFADETTALRERVTAAGPIDAELLEAAFFAELRAQAPALFAAEAEGAAVNAAAEAAELDAAAAEDPAIGAVLDAAEQQPSTAVLVADPAGLFDLVRHYGQHVAKAMAVDLGSHSRLFARAEQEAELTLADIAAVLGLTPETTPVVPAQRGRLTAAVEYRHQGLGVNEHGVPRRTLTGALYYEPLDLDGPCWVLSGYTGAIDFTIGEADIAGAQRWAAALIAHGPEEYGGEAVTVTSWEHHSDAHGPWWEPVYADRPQGPPCS